jgi:hypothetical protein
VIPSIEVAINLGKAFDVSVAFLIGESNVKKQNELSLILSKADIDLLPEVERRALLVDLFWALERMSHKPIDSTFRN